MKLDDLIYDGIENTLDERLSQYSADLKKHHFRQPIKYAAIRLYGLYPRLRKYQGSSLSDA